MSLARRDVYATLVVVAGVALALSVLLGWNWPLLNGVRAGIIALGITGVAACSVSGWASEAPSFTNPFILVGVFLGVIAFGAGLIGLFAGTTPYLVAMVSAIALLWIVTIVHRLLAGAGTRRLTTA
jgi:hypothetical protein